jgi:hypothetical protein
MSDKPWAGLPWPDKGKIMNRHEWKFMYTADRLLGAATTKKAWHESRLHWWAKKRDEIKETIKSEGIEIDESVAFGTETYLSNKSTHRGSTVSIRNDLVKDLTECVNKVSEHQNKVKDYDAWMQVLTSQGQATFDLNQDDWLFFFGK